MSHQRPQQGLGVDRAGLHPPGAAADLQARRIEHVAGRAYMGRFCARVISDVEPYEISLVDDPADKRARIVAISDGEETRDFLSWRATPGSPGP